jgi:protein-tyrosine phosphatase
MIDLHCHILSGIDDGAATPAESLQMARSLARSGFRIVAATPHLICGTDWMPSVDTICSQVADLNRQLDENGIALEIVAGMEIAIDPQIPKLLTTDRLLPLGACACVLIEPGFQVHPPGWEQLLFAIQASGHPVLLAHPERCFCLDTDPKVMDRLVASGVYLQVNWCSFTGRYGPSATRAAHLMAAGGQIHCLGTDSHHPADLTAETIQAIASQLIDMIGRKNFHRLTCDNPGRLLNGEAPRPMQPVASMPGKAKKPWWRFW